MLIVLEGLDGSGKSTQICLLSQRMTDMGLPHLTTREPSDALIGTLARAAVHDSQVDMENETLALLFAADRYQHIMQEILPAQNRGEVVLCDRYYYSNLVYQGNNPEGLQRLMAYNQVAMSAHRPDITFFLDVEPEECLRRINARSNQVSKYENLPSLRQTRQQFLSIFESLSDNCVIIDCSNADKNEVFNKIWQHIYHLSF